MDSCWIAGELRRLRDEHELRMVEDCAQSMAAAGDLAATSFYPTKNLGAMGDGGAILSRNAELDARVRALRDYGQTAKYRHDFIGYNSRLDELQAAFLRRACLPRLERWTARRREIAAAYLKGIKNPAVRLPSPPEGSEPSWHLFPVWIDPARRNHFGGRHYPIAIPDQKALRGVPFEVPGGCENARRLCASEVSLPIHPYLNDARGRRSHRGGELAFRACPVRWPCAQPWRSGRRCRGQRRLSGLLYVKTLLICVACADLGGRFLKVLDAAGVREVQHSHHVFVIGKSPGTTRYSAVEGEDLGSSSFTSHSASPICAAVPRTTRAFGSL